MKKILLLAAVAALALVLTQTADTRRDVGALLPVQTLTATRRAGQYELRGDGGLLGRGNTWPEAMADLEQTASGKAFFGCTGHVLLDKSALDALPAALADTRLRPAARLYESRGTVSPDDATAYLAAHPGGKTIQQLTADALAGNLPPLPLLTADEGRLHLHDG